MQTFPSLELWQIILLIWAFSYISKGFFDEAGRKLLNWILKVFQPSYYGKKIFKKLEKDLKSIYSLSKDTVITRYKVIKERDDEAEAWSEIDIGDFKDEGGVNEALISLSATSALYKTKRFLNEDFKEALNLAMLEKMAKEKGMDLSTQIKDTAAEEKISEELEIMRKIVNDEDKFRLFKEEGIKRNINLQEYGSDTLETSKEQFAEMLSKIANVGGEVDVVRIGRSTTYNAVKNRIVNNPNLQAIYLLARGTNKEKLKDFEEKLLEDLDYIWPPATDNRSYHEWKIDGSEYGSISLKLDINEEWRENSKS